MILGAPINAQGSFFAEFVTSSIGDRTNPAGLGVALTILVGSTCPIFADYIQEEANGILFLMKHNCALYNLVENNNSELKIRKISIFPSTAHLKSGI